jgi:hypothetical protein
LLLLLLLLLLIIIIIIIIIITTIIIIIIILFVFAGTQGLYNFTIVEVSIAFKFFIETGLLALCSNPQPGGTGLHIFIPWRLRGPVIPPGTEYPF